MCIIKLDFFSSGLVYKHRGYILDLDFFINAYRNFFLEGFYMILNRVSEQFLFDFLSVSLLPNRV